jgi:hypothetical protein
MNVSDTLYEYTIASPFGSGSARGFSNYSAFESGSLRQLLDGREPSRRARITEAALRAFLQSDNCSCVAAKAAVATEGYRFGYYPGFEPAGALEGVARDLAAFAAERPSIASRYVGSSIASGASCNICTNSTRATIPTTHRWPAIRLARSFRSASEALHFSSLGCTPMHLVCRDDSYAGPRVQLARSVRRCPQDGCL